MTRSKQIHIEIKVQPLTLKWELNDCTNGEKSWKMKIMWGWLECFCLSVSVPVSVCLSVSAVSWSNNIMRLIWPYIGCMYMYIKAYCILLVSKDHSLAIKSKKFLYIPFSFSFSESYTFHISPLFIFHSIPEDFLWCSQSVSANCSLLPKHFPHSYYLFILTLSGERAHLHIVVPSLLIRFFSLNKWTMEPQESSKYCTKSHGQNLPWLREEREATINHLFKGIVPVYLLHFCLQTPSFSSLCWADENSCQPPVKEGTIRFSCLCRDLSLSTPQITGSREYEDFQKGAISD